MGRNAAGVGQRTRRRVVTPPRARESHRAGTAGFGYDGSRGRVHADSVLLAMFEPRR
jgi:hypothetical protein